MSNPRQKISDDYSADACINGLAQLQKTHKTKSTEYRGFHLIEVLVVCSILAIALLISVPSYQHYLRDAKRAEAKVMLLRYASALERFYFLHHTYQGASPSMLHLPSRIASAQYQIALVNLSEHAYILHAIPQGIQAKRDRACAVFVLNQEGERSVTGSESALTCWQ